MIPSAGEIEGGLNASPFVIAEFEISPMNFNQTGGYGKAQTGSSHFRGTTFDVGFALKG